MIVLSLLLRIVRGTIASAAKKRIAPIVVATSSWASASGLPCSRVSSRASSEACASAFPNCSMISRRAAYPDRAQAGNARRGFHGPVGHDYVGARSDGKGRAICRIDDLRRCRTRDQLTIHEQL
jgi:hypothetical protein